MASAPGGAPSDRGGAPSADRTEPAEATDLVAVHDALRRRGALLVHHEGGVHVAVLEPGHPIVVGRDAPSAVRVPDRALSRSHARFSLVGRLVRVEDLGSTNGTWIAGQRVTTADIAPGAEVKLGSALARVHLLDRAGAPASPAEIREAAIEGDVVIGPALRPLFDTAARVADSRLSVLLQGETGTGKEVLARHVHARSPRASKPFLAVNCGAIPSQLLESTLFGHERGAFTGAIQQHKGVFEAAHGGTVFLDEIGELPLPAQAALLLVLENGRFCRVGSTREVAVDVRVIAASHADLAEMIRAGRFRADLYYRLQGAVLRLPPLRDRKDEIPALVEKLLHRANAQHGRGASAIAPDAMDALLAHDWPGNVRELRNAVDQAVVVASGSIVTLPDLPAHLRSRGASQEAGARSPSRPPASDEAGDALPSDDEGADDEAGELRARVDRFEAKLIREALDATGFRRAEAAKKLGLPLRTLARRIKQLGIKEPR